MSQRAPLTKAEKQIIVEKKAAGLSLGQISEELGCSLETTRKWWRRVRDRQSVQPRGRPKRGALSTYPQTVVEKAIEIKKAHPHWGPEMVNLELKKVLRLGEKGLPSAARLSVLFKERCQEAVQPHEPRMLPLLK
jgi:transposase-like protein